VNPGSEIRSKGSIIVLGGLYGRAHAGSYGNASSFICAIEMEAEGLMIGEAEYVPDSEPVWSAVLKSSPKVARIVNDEITIGPLNRVVMEKIYESKKLQDQGL
jgi:septum site-determining protein MinC